MGLTSWILWNGEKLGSRVISRFFWPPCSASALVVRNGEILAVKTDNYYMLPGGLMNSGETFTECAEREVREETGFDVEIGDLLMEFSKEFAGVEKVFSAEIKGGEMKGSWEGEPVFLDMSEVEDVRWRWGRDIKKLLEKSDISTER